MAIRIYNRTPGCAKLQLAPTGTKNVDAISRNGDRYSIKTITQGTTSTGTFQADDFSEKRFEYAVLVVLDEYFQPLEVLEANWDHVNKHKRMHKTMRAYNIPVTAAFREGCKVIFERSVPSQARARSAV